MSIDPLKWFKSTMAMIGNCNWYKNFGFLLTLILCTFKNSKSI